MEKVKSMFDYVSENPSDINEHIPTLYKYSKECSSVLELGVRGCVSSWAFINGLLDNDKPTKKLFMNDLNECNISEIIYTTQDLPINIKYEWISDLDLQLDDKYDLVFIDTWHVYGQLKRELAKYSQIANKYIIMHDTVIFGVDSEQTTNIEHMMEQTGFTREEVTDGLLRALGEFLIENDEWTIKESFDNNNGLTVLEKSI